MKKIITLILSAYIAIGASAQNYDSLDANNIHAGFNASGDLFYNINTGTEKIGTPQNAIGYSIGNLWIGGLDQTSQIRVAAQTYRQSGTDFWYGPLDTNSLTCDSVGILNYNRVWKLNCATVDSFVAYTQSPTSYPGYVVPQAIQDWPGNGSSTYGYGTYFAPFTDVDGDGLYNWAAGDYPNVRGTQSLFYIYNDNCDQHTESGNPYGIGLEIHAMPYAFNYPWDDALMNTIFVHYTIINRGTIGYSNAAIGFWADIDYAAGNTRIGSDSLLQTSYQYNAASSAGILFLNNQMGGVIAYDNSSAVWGNPTATNHYYNYLMREWKDGAGLTHGSNGYNGGSPTNWIYDGDPATGTGWNDGFNVDKRVVSSTPAFTLQPGARISFDIALVYAYDSSATYASIGLMKQYMQHVKTFYAGQDQFCYPGLTGNPELNAEKNIIAVYPNPAANEITLQSGSEKAEQFSIFDMNGQLLKTGFTTGGKTKIDIGSLSSGIYLLEVGEAGATKNIRFAKTD